MTAVVVMEGILRKPNGDPIPEGLKLYRTLLLSYRVVLSSNTDGKETDHWLKTNYVFDYSDVFDTSHFYTDTPLEIRHAELARQGGKLELFVAADADLCAQVLAQGVPTILFSNPKYFQSDRKIKPWSAIAEEKERQKKIVAERYSDFISNEGKRWE